MPKLPTNPQQLEEYLEIVELLAKENYTSNIPAAFYKPGYVPPDQGDALLVVTLVSMTLAFLVVALRLFTKIYYSSSRLGADDWCIVVATVFTIGFTAIQCIGVFQGGIGMHLYDLGIDNWTVDLPLTYVHEIIYCFCMMFTKLSILFFIRRVIGSAKSRIRKVCNIFLVFNVIWPISSALAFAFACHPIAGGYNLWARLQHRCDGVTNSYYVLCSIQVISDLAILILPIPTVLGLQMPPRKKLGVLVMFTIGGFGCIACICRMVYLFQDVDGTDITWKIMPVVICGQLEATLGIVSTSVPSLRFLYKKFRRWGAQRSDGFSIFNSMLSYISFSTSGKEKTTQEASMTRKSSEAPFVLVTRDRDSLVKYVDEMSTSVSPSEVVSHDDTLASVYNASSPDIEHGPVEIESIPTASTTASLPIPTRSSSLSVLRTNPIRIAHLPIATSMAHNTSRTPSEELAALRHGLYRSESGEERAVRSAVLAASKVPELSRNSSYDV